MSGWNGLCFLSDFSTPSKCFNIVLESSSICLCAMYNYVSECLRVCVCTCECLSVSTLIFACVFACMCVLCRSVEFIAVVWSPLFPYFSSRSPLFSVLWKPISAGKKKKKDES